jgi:hypothetical protein
MDADPDLGSGNIFDPVSGIRDEKKFGSEFFVKKKTL